jgi:hypothetical protein
MERWVGMLVEDVVEAVDCLEVVVGVVDFGNTIVVVDYCIDTAVVAVDLVEEVVVDSDYWSIAAAALFDVVEFAAAAAAAAAVATKKIAQE